MNTRVLQVQIMGVKQALTLQFTETITANKM